MCSVPARAEVLDAVLCIPQTVFRGAEVGVEYLTGARAAVPPIVEEAIASSEGHLEALVRHSRASR